MTETLIKRFKARARPHSTIEIWRARKGRRGWPGLYRVLCVDHGHEETCTTLPAARLLAYGMTDYCPQCSAEKQAIAAFVADRPYMR